jgi:hypothetical protein
VSHGSPIGCQPAPKFAIEVDAARVLPRSGPQAIRVEVPYEPQLEAARRRPLAQAPDYRPAGALVAMDASDDEHLGAAPVRPHVGGAQRSALDRRADRAAGEARRGRIDRKAAEREAGRRAETDERRRGARSTTRRSGRGSAPLLLRPDLLRHEHLPLACHHGDFSARDSLHAFSRQGEERLTTRDGCALEATPLCGRG